ncbi:MAG TPA: hypothetical protein ENI95_15700 [Chloroflexi bacterium]|nr:hypothetical protein [Chloroflexota bacterium]
MPFRPRLGLTLSGGGARGGAHLGVLRVLEEVGYRPDIVVGTSAGGLVAAMIGAGWSLEDMETFFTQANFADMIYLDRSGGGLVGTERFAGELRARFGDADLRDFSPRVAVIAADIRKRQRILIDRGPVVKAILATTAVPGLFPPVEWGEYLLVDGGVADNIPTQATYRLGAQRIVAVDAARDQANPEMALATVGAFSKRLQRALYWLLSLSNRQKALEVLINSTTLSIQTLASYHLSAYPPDILICPEMPQVGLFTVERIPEAIRAGEEAARRFQDQIRRLTKLPCFRGRPEAHRIPPLVAIELE